jgi:DNA-binding CsgD family transcriptional regulator
VAQGATTPAIAERLGLSPRTIETHRTNLMRKLGLRTQTDLIRYALQRGLIPLQD